MSIALNEIQRPMELKIPPVFRSLISKKIYHSMFYLIALKKSHTYKYTSISPG
jgi:hypothetical protein